MGGSEPRSPVPHLSNEFLERHGSDSQ
jgi:hypothetical protein